MNITNKIFLYWLLYLAVVFLALSASVVTGLAALVIQHDHSYLTYVLIGTYFLTEILSGKQLLWINSKHKEMTTVLSWLQEHELTRIDIVKKTVTFVSYDASLKLNAGLFSNLIRSFYDKSKNSFAKQIDQATLLNSYYNNIYSATSICEFLSGRIVLLGILATIIGVTIAFWPFLQPGMNLDMMREHVGQFFPGVAVAFIPTAVSFVFKLALDINARITSGAVENVADMATTACSSYILPFLEHGE